MIDRPLSILVVGDRQDRDLNRSLAMRFSESRDDVNIAVIGFGEGMAGLPVDVLILSQSPRSERDHNWFRHVLSLRLLPGALTINLTGHRLDYFER